MNKKVLGILSLSVVALSAGLLGGKMTRTAAYSDDIWNNFPELGETNADSYFTNAWHKEVGSRRYDDRAVLVTDQSNFGLRGKIPGRKFDITSFYVELDLSHILPNTAVTMTLGTNEGLYSNEAGREVSIDIAKSGTGEPLYLVAVSVLPSEHNQSIESFTDHQTWAEDANWVGVQVTATDGVISIGFHKDNNINTTITVNEVATIVENSELYAKTDADYAGYFTCGMMNNGGAEQNYIIRKIGDAAYDTYYSAEGAFGKTKAICAELNSVEEEGATVEQVLAAKDLFDTIPYSSLYSWDRAWLGSIYNPVAEKIGRMVEAAGVEVALRLMEAKVAELDEAVKTLTNVKNINDALAALNAAYDTKAAVSEADLTGDQVTRFATASNKIEVAEAAIIAAMEEKYEAAVKSYEDLVEEGMVDYNDYLVIMNAKSNIPTNWNAYLDEAFTEALANRIGTASAKFSEDTTLEHENWIQGVGGRVINKGDNGIDVVSYGSAMGQARETSSGIYCTELISGVDFDLQMSFNRFGAGSGSWITFGIMENSGMWIYEDENVQDNKGIFFLCTKVNSTTVGIQAFLCSLTSNRFYDSPLTTNIQVPMNEMLNISFKEVEETIAGVTETYFQMHFGEANFDVENITARKMKTVLGSSKAGYFFVASSGYNAADPAIVSIKSINGVNPLAASIAKGEVGPTTEQPTSSTTSKDFVEGGTNDVVFNLDTKGSAITSVKVDNKAISAGDYSYSGTNFTLKNSYLSTLKVGAHTVVVTTAGGSVTWTLNVQADPNQGGKKGCGSSVMACSIIISSLAAIGSCLLAKKKNED